MNCWSIHLLLACSLTKPNQPTLAQTHTHIHTHITYTHTTRNHARTPCTRTLSQWVTVMAPSPWDVYWPNVTLSIRQKFVRNILILTLTTLLVLFWAIPITFISSIASISTIKSFAPKVGRAVGLESVDVWLLHFGVFFFFRWLVGWLVGWWWWWLCVGRFEISGQSNCLCCCVSTVTQPPCGCFLSRCKLQVAEWIESNKAIEGFVTGNLPTIIILVFMSLLPKILYFMTKVQVRYLDSICCDGWFYYFMNDHRGI